MATKFINAGGDEDFLVNTTNGFWGSSASGTIATDFVHGAHVKSIEFTSNATYGEVCNTAAGTAADAGGRISVYVYLNTLPASGDNWLFGIEQSGSVTVAKVGFTNTGVLKMYQAGTTQIGTNGPTLVTGKWYRISLAWTITSTTINRFEVFLDGVSAISITNATLTSVISSKVAFGTVIGGYGATGVFDIRESDFYVDDSSALTDTGNIWVTAKRPVSNGTLNQWTTQIGAGGSGYGSGHTPQINERPLSTTNGWSIQNAATQTEEYTIEGKSVGDIDITTASIIDYMGWVSAKVGSASTGNIIVAGVATNISLTTAFAVFTKFAGSIVYPSGNTDIGMDTNTVNQLFSLAECGIIVAYIPAPPSLSSQKAVVLNQAVNRSSTY